MAGRGVDLKNEDDVKDYLERLGIEYRFGCYHEKNPKACHLLGDYMESINKDFNKALKIYQTNCNEYLHGHSCHKAGGYYFAGRGCHRDVDTAYDYWRKGCDLHATVPHAKACLNAGLLDALEPGTKIGGVAGHRDEMVERKRSHPDPKKALELFKKACDNEKPEAEACHRYASMLLIGFEGAIDRSATKALPYAAKACDLGIPEACVNTSIMYKKGDGVDKNERQAKIYATVAKDIIEQMQEERQRTRFQEGVETGTEVPL